MAFFISTGDLKGTYLTLSVVTAHVALDTPAFGPPNFKWAHQHAIDMLAQEAQKLGANGVIWIPFTPRWIGQLGGFILFAAGTAVIVTEAN